MNNKKIWQIGELKQRVIDLLKINFKVCPIYIGDDNIEHIKSEHPNAYARYGADIKDILTFMPIYLYNNHSFGYE